MASHIRNTMKTKGIIYVCFGREFDESLAGLMRVNRRSTGLPVTVMTNQKEPSPIWKKLRDIRFIYFDLPQKDNRQVKTSAINYSPYDQTLLLDADTVIQRKGARDIFLDLDHADIIVSPEFTIQSGELTYNIYKRTIEKTKTKLPLTVASGGFLVFNKNERVNHFFELWHSYWQRMGSGREMPSLACALKNSSAHVVYKSGIYSQRKRDPNCIIQHNWNWRTDFWSSLRSNIFKKYGVRNPNSDKSFDVNENEDWKMVKCD